MSESEVSSNWQVIELDDNKEQQTKDSCLRRAWHSVLPQQLCPKFSWPVKIVTFLVGLVVLVGALISLIGRPALPPHGPIFQMLQLFVLSAVVGQLVSLIRLPPLLGMLLTGVALRNVSAFNMEGFYLEAVGNLRLCAMVVILTKAGLGLDPNILKQLSCVVLRLALCPCFVEAVTAMCAARLLLGMPWIWGILLGSILAAVSPAVVVPSLLSLKERGYGEDKGIATLVIAASSIDDIAAISAFGIFFGIIFAEESLLTLQILQGPLEVIIGLSFGLCYGALMIYLPHIKDVKVIIWRAILVGGGGILAVLGSQRIEFDGAGPLGCITAAFVASCGWRNQQEGATKPVEKIYSQLWLIFQPVLFGLIGTEIVISKLDSSTILLGLGVLFCGLVMRIITVGVITLGGTLSIKEQLFVAIAWLPKATVQAALASVALDKARQTDASEEVIALAEQVLTVAVLSILVTAPIGAIGISFSGPKLLTVTDRTQHQQADK